MQRAERRGAEQRVLRVGGNFLRTGTRRGVRDFRGSLPRLEILEVQIPQRFLRVERSKAGGEKKGGQEKRGFHVKRNK